MENVRLWWSRRSQPANHRAPIHLFSPKWPEIPWPARATRHRIPRDRDCWKCKISKCSLRKVSFFSSLFVFNRKPKWHPVLPVKRGPRFVSVAADIVTLSLPTTSIQFAWQHLCVISRMAWMASTTIFNTGLFGRVKKVSELLTFSFPFHIHLIVISAISMPSDMAHVPVLNNSLSLSSSNSQSIDCGPSSRMGCPALPCLLYSTQAS